VPQYALIAQATPVAPTLSQHLPQSFFARPAELVAPELIGCLLVKRQPNGELLWGVTKQDVELLRTNIIIRINR